MAHLKFDLAKLERLNDPGRFEDLDPVRMWDALALDLDRAPVIVEIGAGTGLFSARFAATAPGSTVYAVDVEPAMLAWMTEHRPEVAAGTVVPVLSAESAVPLPDGLADAVVMINLHHELAEPAPTYAEALRLLRPGGRLLVVDWAPGGTQGGPPEAVRADDSLVAALLTAAGFAEVRIHDPLPRHWMLTATRG